MKGYSLGQFRKVPVHHILFALVFAGCFGAAYHFSRHVDFAPENKSNNTDTDTDAAEDKNVDHGPPYCIFGAVAGGVHFLLFLLCYALNEKARGNKEEQEGAKGILGLYRILGLLCMLYSIAGTVLTGISGICSNMEDCKYKMFQTENLALSISITALHVLSFFHCLFIWMATTHTEKEIQARITPAPAPKNNATNNKQQTPNGANTANKNTTDNKQQTPNGAGTTNKKDTDNKQQTPNGASTANKKATDNKQQTPNVASTANKKTTDNKQQTPARPNTANKKTNDNKQQTSSRERTANKKATDTKRQTPKDATSMGKQATDNKQPTRPTGSTTITTAWGPDATSNQQKPATAESDKTKSNQKTDELMALQFVQENNQRFHGDGGFYIPVFPLTPLPAPPSYNVAVSGAYSNPAFEPATMEQTTFQPPGWSPGPELDRSTEYNSEISHCYMRSTSGIPPDAESIVVRPNTASL